MTVVTAPSHVVVRDAVPGDHDAVMALPGLAASTRRRLAAELAGEDRRGWVAVDDGRIVGWLGLWLAPDEAHVLDVAVAADHRRRGVASHLVEVARSAAVATGRRHVTLEVRRGNVGARRLYAALGFVEVGVRTGYYPSQDDRPAEDAVVAWWPDAPDGTPLQEVPPC